MIILIIRDYSPRHSSLNAALLSLVMAADSDELVAPPICTNSCSLQAVSCPNLLHCNSGSSPWCLSLCRSPQRFISAIGEMLVAVPNALTGLLSYLTGGVLLLSFMHDRLSLAALLNPIPPEEDQTRNVQSQQSHSQHFSTVFSPIDTSSSVAAAHSASLVLPQRSGHLAPSLLHPTPESPPATPHRSHSFSEHLPSTPQRLCFYPACSPSPPRLPTQRNVYLNRKTTLLTLYEHDINAYVEYPQTSNNEPIGHLFRMDPLKWENPVLKFAYSLGYPSGHSKRGAEVTCRLLVDDTAAMVPCSERHFTCMAYLSYLCQ